VIGDLSQLDTLGPAMEGVDKVFLLTPASQNEAELKAGVVNAAKRASVTHIVLLSGAGNSLYSPISQAREHWLAEDHLKASGVPFTILQAHYFMQNFFSQIGAMRAQGSIFGNFKDGKLAMVDTRDIAAVAAAVLMRGGFEGQTLVVSGHEALSTSEAAERLSAVLGKTLRYVDLPSEQLIQGLTSGGVPEWLARDLAGLGELASIGHWAQTTNTVERVAEKNAITFDQFVRDHSALLT
jgi:uncharacterized protein YbjT (DUF2867 family)